MFVVMLDCGPRRISTFDLQAGAAVEDVVFIQGQTAYFDDGKTE